MQHATPSAPDSSTTHFGYQTVAEAEKTAKVAQIFHSVAQRYDVMNDLMSLGLHRAWKAFAIARANVRPGMRVLDIAGGTGDLARAFAKQAGQTGQVWLTDINESMLRVGRERMIDRGLVAGFEYVQCNAEKLPFPDHSFDLITMAFGLRNVTDKPAALREMHRVLNIGGQARILEFSEVKADWFKPVYDFHSFKILPRLGKLFAGDRDSYQYLAESIRKHPPQDELKAMLDAAGFERTRYRNLSGGIVAIHDGFKL